MSIKYRENASRDVVTVLLEGRVVGHIRKLAFGLGWVYAPKGAISKGDPMPTLAAVKASIEGVA